MTVELQLGQVIVTAPSTSWVSRGVAWATNSRVNHAFVVTGAEVAVEAAFPRVREVNYRMRLDQLIANDRAYAILDYPHIHGNRRRQVAAKARSYVGRRYDITQIGLFALTGQFWNDGLLRLICTRLITSSYDDGAGLDLFPDSVIESKYPTGFKRAENLRAGYVVPADFLRSKLVVTHFHASTRIPTLAEFLRPLKEPT